jgi:hypothetical protein
MAGVLSGNLTWETGLHGVVSQLSIRLGQYKDWLFDSLWRCLI